MPRQRPKRDNGVELEVIGLNEENGDCYQLQQSGDLIIQQIPSDFYAKDLMVSRRLRFFAGS